MGCTVGGELLVGTAFRGEGKKCLQLWEERGGQGPQSDCK